MDNVVAEHPTGHRTGPLQGLLVLDFGQAAVGPVAAEYLGMMGATVIKVESPRGDTVRFGNPLMKGTSTTFIGNNLTKFGVVLDLKSDAGKEEAKRLIRIADVLIENFRSNDVMVRLGLGPDVLCRLNPDLVYVSSSAYGSGGPLDDMRSNEWLTEALGGFTSVTGAKGGPGEFSRGTANLDWNGAMINTVALLAALVRRARRGGGGYFTTSQFGSSVYGGVTRFADALAGRPVAGPLGSGSPHIVPDEAFRTADGWIAVSAPTQRCWVRLCAALGRPALADDPRFATNAARILAREELSGLLADAFMGDTSAAWCDRLGEADVPCAPVPRGMKLLDAMQSHTQMRAADLLRHVPSAYGEIVSQAPHWHFEQTPAAITSGPPLLGEHTDLVLANLHDKAGLIAVLEAARPAAGPVALETAR
jgi:crotonobetainyl-CoA:carnitine CoA-transferase CaiB-like acyl-CoA transferase